MAIRDLSFPSANGRDQIQAWIAEPVRPPRGVVQIVHGLGEHSRCYFHMVGALLDAGFVVAADDHAGHGRTAVLSGVWADTGDNGADAVVADEVTLRDRVRSFYPGLPHFLFAHSWGSVIGRVVAARHSDELAGLVLCGLLAQSRSFEQDLDRTSLDARIAAGEGMDRDAEVSGGSRREFYERVDPAADRGNWVVTDPNVAREHDNDPLKGHGPITLRFLRDIVTNYDRANSEEFYSAVRTDLPVLLLSGGDDPATNFGEGAYHVANKLARSGHRDVRTRVWPGYRHEIFAEPDIQDDVEDEIIEFVTAHLS